MVDWFRRFGDIPGISFDGTPGIDPRRLPGYGAVPKVHIDAFEGRRRESLWWPANGGESTASPAHGRAFGDFRNIPTPELLKNCYEALELPGQASDYHFLVQGCANALWGRRGREPEVLQDVENLCRLDIELIEAGPNAVRDEFSEQPKFYAVLTFSILIALYEREGFLHEALDVAERAALYGQGLEARDRLAERVAAMENEDRA